jgi:hypothetical protein
MRDAVSRLFAWLAGTDADESRAEADGTDGGGDFAGSLLDASVNRGHGQGDPQAASEMAELQSEADRLAEQDQHRER